MNENELTLNEINESRKHKLKVWLATLGVALFSGLVAVGVYATQSYKKSNAFSYDDSNKSITLNDTEVVYTYENASNYIYSLQDGLSISYNDSLYGVDEYTGTSIAFMNPSDDYIYFSFVENADGMNDYRFYKLDDGGSSYSYITTTITINFYAPTLTTEDIPFSDIVNAFEIDISDNQPLVLSAYDLNNKSYGYLVSQFITLQPESDMGYLLYDGNKYVLDDLDFNTDGYISFYNETINAGISLNFSTGKWVGTSTDYVFVHDLYIYNNFIKENIYAPMDTNGFISILDTIVSILTGGIVGVSTGVGAGVSTLVSDIFVSNNALSVMGAMIVIFAGISLAIGLCRWVMNFLTSLGAKK